MAPELGVLATDYSPLSATQSRGPLTGSCVAYRTTLRLLHTR